jgi:uncharacterized membrane protein
VSTLAEVFDVFAAFGLSSSAGLNAYLPLLIAGFMTRFTNLFELGEPYDALGNGWVLAVVSVLCIVEITVDKIPAVDTINDTIQTLVRPTAGALLFAASTDAVDGVHPVLAVILGLVTSGTIHGTKVVVRPLVTGTTAGMGNAPLSALEDIFSAVTAFAAIIVPVLAIVLVLMLLAPVTTFIWRRRRKQKQKRLAQG